MKTVSPYLSAEALGLKEMNRQALIGLSSDLSNHKIPDDEWNMSNWASCICGHLQKRTDIELTEKSTILKLFTGYSYRVQVPGDWPPISQEEAGKAAFNYLTLGEPHWEDVLNA